MIDVSPHQLEIIQKILRQHVPDCEVRAFGSRVTWTAKDYSDLDLVIVGKEKLPQKIIFALKEDFVESELSFRVDILDWNEISPEFKKNIEKRYEIIPIIQKGKFKKTEIGLIPEGWEVECLDSLCEISSSKRIFLKEYVNKGIPFYRSKEIILLSRNQEINVPLFISREKFDDISLKYGAPKEGDLLMTSVGTLGVPYIIRKNQIFYFKDGNLMWFKSFKNKLLNTYLYYWIKCPLGQQQLDSIAIGSTQKALTIDSLKRTELPLPSLCEQKAIAKILSDLDAKIELNHQMNKTLEQIAQAIFKHWFIDFEFPNKEGKPYKSNGGRMIKSDMGEIPQGWEVGDLIDVAEIIMGQSPPGESYNETGNGMPFYQGNRDFGFRYPSNRVFCILPTRFAKEGDILLSVRAPVGELNVAVEKCAIGRGVCAIHMRNFSNSFLLYLLKLKTDLWNNFNSEGTVFGCLNKTELHKIKIVVPPCDYLKVYDKIIVSIDKQILNNEMQNRQLSQIRDLLLPKLVSGKIRLKGV